jgi:hypothetical protein
MVVVPTERDVSMTFERTTSDYFFYLATLGGIVMLILLRRKGDADVRSDWELAAAPAGGVATTAFADAPAPLPGARPFSDDDWITGVPPPPVAGDPRGAPTSGDQPPASREPTRDGVDPDADERPPPPPPPPPPPAPPPAPPPSSASSPDPPLP